MSRFADAFDIDTAALDKRYDEERDKRRNLRPEGGAQFFRMRGSAFEDRLADPFSTITPRDPVNREVEVAIIGGGFAGLLAAARLTEQGIADILVLERGGDFGGTWYWNRYPGAACDVESYIYLPMLEEVGTMPSMRYAFQPEILAHVQALAKHYDLYPRALMHTNVGEARFDEARSRWTITSDRGDAISARFVILASGHYREPKLPKLPGIETFKAKSFHTSRWDYGYTGGGPHEPMTGLNDKVVGVVGTGATAVQCVPPLAGSAKQLYVFQRTPSSVDVRANRPTDPGWYNALRPGWHQERMRNFVLAVRGMSEVDMIQDGWTQMYPYFRNLGRPNMTAEEHGELYQMIDYQLMVDIRARVDAVIDDPETAESLKPWYNWLCKRPCYHDEYLQAFNRDNVTLVDTKGVGIERLTEDGVVANGREYKVDCLVFATGFELAPHEQGTPIPVFGRNGLALEEKWNNGATTMHGMHVHGFPNFMIATSRQGSHENNFTFQLDFTASHLARLIRLAKDRGAETVEVTAQAEADWVRFHEQVSQRNLQGWKDCTPSYFNQEGLADERIVRNGTIGLSAVEFDAALTEWREKGDFAGLEFR